MGIDYKLRLIISLLFDGSNTALANQLGVAKTTVMHWTNGQTIKSEQLAQLLRLGINVNWLLDDTWTDINGMFADNAAGTALRSKYFGQATPGQSAQVPTSAATTTPAKPAARKGSTKRGPA